MADFLRRTGSFVKRHTLGRNDPAAEDSSRRKVESKSMANPNALTEAPEVEPEDQLQIPPLGQEKHTKINHSCCNQTFEKDQATTTQEIGYDVILKDKSIKTTTDYQQDLLFKALKSNFINKHHSISNSEAIDEFVDVDSAHVSSEANEPTDRLQTPSPSASYILHAVSETDSSFATPIGPDYTRIRSSSTSAAFGHLDTSTMTIVDHHGSNCTTIQPQPRRLVHKRSISDVVSGTYSMGTQSPDTDSNTDASDSGDETVMPDKEGILAKWTNYIHGWQERYVVLSVGVLSYFKSKEDKEKICRGNVDLTQATVKPHPYDPVRFDIILKDSAYYLRASSEEERNDWIQHLEDTKRMRNSNLKRRPSSMSLTSMSSGTSAQSSRFIENKSSEARALHDVLVKQVGQLQHFMASDTIDVTELQQNLALVKATSSGLITSMSEWMDVMTRREEKWRQKYQKLRDSRQELEKELTACRTVAQQQFPNNPDFEEGPHSALNDEEFFDALETGLDQLEAEEEAARRERLLEEERRATRPLASGPALQQYLSLLETRISENLQLADEPVAERWLLTHQEGEMKVYTRDEEAGGEPTDQLKAFHYIPGLTAHEICSYFFNTKIRLEWEHTVEKFYVLDHIDDCTNITHNVHKRVWPTAQRDSCILSHIRQLQDSSRWIVQNTSVDHEDAPSDKYVRLTANVLLMATTSTPTGSRPHDDLKRSEIGVKLIYLAYIHPGGWAPASVVKAVSKREYPKFLRNIEQHSINYYKDNPIMW